MLKLRIPCTAILSGATMSGKTVFVRRLLTNADVMFDPVPVKVLYCYGAFQSVFNDMQRDIANIEFHEGLPSDAVIGSLPPNSLIFTDDLMKEASSSDTFEKLFTKIAHHRQIGVFHIVQNLFYKGKNVRTIMLNSMYFFLFRNPRDQSQIVHLAKQIAPGHTKFVHEAYADSTKRPFGYLYINLHPDALEELKYATNILPDEQPTFVYIKRQ